MLENNLENSPKPENLQDLQSVPSETKKKPISKRLTLVQSYDVDNMDLKLDNYLVNLYQKKRLSQIPFRRLSKGEYEFGSQKVLLKVEGETIRGMLSY